MDDQAGRDSDLAAPAEQAGQRHEQAVGALHRTRDAEERSLPAADHGYFFWLGLLMATMHQPNPRTVMRDVKPSAKAVGEPTALLDGAAAEPDMPPGWQPTVDDGHRVVAETWAGAPGVAPRGSPGVLVGRTRELATITTAMTAARRTWCPGREVGIGKTALAEHAAVMASGQEWAVVCNTLRGGLTRGK